MFKFKIDKVLSFKCAQLGWPGEYIAESLYKDLKNHCSATYYLLSHDYQSIL
jgi:hypothetical protein